MNQGTINFMVFHDQSQAITDAVQKLDQELSYKLTNSNLQTAFEAHFFFKRASVFFVCQRFSNETKKTVPPFRIFVTIYELQYNLYCKSYHFYI